MNNTKSKNIMKKNILLFSIVFVANIGGKIYGSSFSGLTEDQKVAFYANKGWGAFIKKLKEINKSTAKPLEKNDENEENNMIFELEKPILFSFRMWCCIPDKPNIRFPLLPGKTSECAVFAKEGYASVENIISNPCFAANGKYTKGSLKGYFGNAEWIDSFLVLLPSEVVTVEQTSLSS